MSEAGRMGGRRSERYSGGRMVSGPGFELPPGSDGGAGAGDGYDARRAVRQMLPRLVLGLGLAALGVLFTLDNLDVLEARRYAHWWPALIVAFGLAKLVAAASNSDRVGGVIWTLVGGMMLADNLDLLHVSIFDLWPLFLVVIGARLVMRSARPRSAVPGDDSSTTHAFAMMSGVVRRSSSPAYQGGSLTAIMGGAEVDLRQARMQPGETAVLDTFAFWGGLEISVPAGWIVEGRVWPLMGGYEDKTTPPAPEDATGKLVITGAAIMGGVSVKN